MRSGAYKMIIGIVGSRRRDSESDYRATLSAFLSVYKDVRDSIVSGGCPRGGDRFAELIAKTRNVPILIHPANWVQYGRSAGFQRNTLIARDADVLIACVAEDRTGGTEDTIRKFRAYHPEGTLILV
jgi:hypothetical protein